MTPCSARRARAVRSRKSRNVAPGVRGRGRRSPGSSGISHSVFRSASRARRRRCHAARRRDRVPLSCLCLCRASPARLCRRMGIPAPAWPGSTRPRHRRPGTSICAALGFRRVCPRVNGQNSLRHASCRRPRAPTLPFHVPGASWRSSSRTKPARSRPPAPLEISS